MVLTTTAPTLRRVAQLALPALVVLAAEPLYLLVDTAVVGHLGRVPLAALAIGGQVMSVAVWLGNVLAYGTTGRSARRFGAGDRAGAVAEGVQASWVALTVGVGLLLAVEVLAGPLSGTLAGPHPDVAEGAQRWLRIAALGAPGLMLATAGNGWLRGVQDTRRPMYFVLGANVLSAVACPLLVYGAGLGLVGSAVANAGAQTVSGGLFVWALVRERVPLRPQVEVLRRQLSVGRDLLIRGAAFQASFVSAAAVAARFGAAALAAHQIALQLWMFTAMTLDAVAIAAQALVGAALGAHEAGHARALARQITLVGLLSGIGFALVFAAAAGVLPELFTADRAVHAQAAIVWPWFVGLLPVAGVVFALDGVFLGAGDVAYLRNLTVAAAVLGFLPMTWLALGLHLGLRGVWIGLALFMLLRLATLLARLRSGRWAVVGATR